MNEPQKCPQCNTPLPPGALDGLCPRCLMQGAANEEDYSADRTGGSSSYRRPAPSIEELAPKFPQLEILELLGRGGMGAVYKARQITLDRLVALKILPPDVARDPTFAQRFTREARALAKLNHPQIVAVYDSGQVEGLYYFIMEYVDGVNLREAMQAGTLTPVQALAIVPQVCEALQYAHDEGVVHRDIKPENVLLDTKGRVKVADFGLAKLLGRTPVEMTLTSVHQVLGTLHYMAPEQIEKPFQVDHRADIYSLGVVFYELLTGELPLGRYKLPSETGGANLPPDARLDEIVLKTLERRPEQRYQHASEVKTDVESIVSRSSQASASPPAPDVQRIPNKPSLEKPPKAAPAAARPSRKSSRHWSCPFTISNLFGGFAKATGIVRLEDDRLTLEYEIQDEIFGILRSAPKPGAIDLDQIISADLRAGWFSNKLSFQTDRLHTAGQVPGAAQGRFQLEIAKRDVELAERLIGELRSRLGFEPDVPRPHNEQPNVEEIKHLVYGTATAMIVLGAINVFLGLLAIPFCIAAMERIFDDDLIGFGLIFLGGIPVGALMMVGGVSLKQLISYPLTMVGVIAAMLPVTVLWIFNFPLAIRVFLLIKRGEVAAAFGHGRLRAAPRDRVSAGIRETASGHGLAMMALGLCNILVPICLQITLIILVESRALRPDDWAAMGIPFFLSVPVGVLMLIGGLQLRRLGSSGWANIGVIAAMIPLGPVWCVSLPMALWTLAVIRAPKVKEAFGYRGAADLPRHSFEDTTIWNAPPDETIEQVQRRIKTPGSVLFILGVVNILFPIAFWSLIFAFVASDVIRDDDVLGVAFCFLISIPAGIVMALGGWRMNRARHFGWANAAAVAAALPLSLLWPISLPVSIWTLITLGRPDVQAVFHGRYEPEPRVPPGKPV